MLAPLKTAAVLCVLATGSLALADKKGPKPAAISARVVDLEINEDSTIVTVMAGTDKGIDRTWHARFREGGSDKLLPDGEAIVIRVDRRTTVLKTKLTAKQVRENRIVQFDP